MTKLLSYLFLTFLYRRTGNDSIDNFIYYSSFYLEFAAAIGVVLLVLLNKPLRKRRGVVNRLIFLECILVFCQNVLDISLVPLVSVPDKWADYAFYIAITLNELLYFFIILHWLVCVDYCLYHSKDHLWRRYRHALVPIALVVGMDIIHDFVSAGAIGSPQISHILTAILHILKAVIEIGYIVMAILMVRKHEKTTRVPHFLRLDAFIIPFIFGALVRFYDAPMLGLGIIGTYMAIRRRDRFLDYSMGMYNADFLDHLAGYLDKKKFRDNSAILFYAPSNSMKLKALFEDIKFPDCFQFFLGNDRFLFLSHGVRDSALEMAEKTIIDAAMEEDKSLIIKTRSLHRGTDESATDFVREIKRNFSELTD